MSSGRIWRSALAMVPVTTPNSPAKDVLRRAEALAQHVLAGLFGVVTGTIAKAERQIRPLLTQAGYVIEPAGTRLGTLAELTTYASSHGIELTPKAKPAC